MAKVLVPLAEGFEELEAITVIDLLRRAGFDVTSAGLDEGPVTASRGNVLIPDASIDQVINREFDLIVLPGGLPGANNLRADQRIKSLVQRQNERGGTLGAICAAPRALEASGVLNGKTVTCYPGALDDLKSGAFSITTNAVEIDGNLVTSRGPGTAMDFALTLIEHLGGKSLRDKITAQMVRS